MLLFWKRNLYLLHEKISSEKRKCPWTTRSSKYTQKKNERMLVSYYVYGKRKKKILDFIKTTGYVKVNWKLS